MVTTGFSMISKDFPTSTGDLRRLHGRQFLNVRRGEVVNSKPEKRVEIHRETSIWVGSQRMNKQVPVSGCSQTIYFSSGPFPTTLGHKVFLDFKRATKTLQAQRIPTFPLVGKWHNLRSIWSACSLSVSGCLEWTRRFEKSVPLLMGRWFLNVKWLLMRSVGSVEEEVNSDQRGHSRDGFVSLCLVMWTGT